MGHGDAVARPARRDPTGQGAALFKLAQDSLLLSACGGFLLSVALHSSFPHPSRSSHCGSRGSDQELHADSTVRPRRDGVSSEVYGNCLADLAS
mmetsp:Transcript_27625/g.87325  ORF Transcript_27625/g.87325 Transcript_27625/m.87325 type:complete len:94 (+) Transcript_27625:1590-1871(+)